MGGEVLAKAIADASTALTAERDALIKAVAEKDDALTKLADRIEPLAKTVADLVAANAELAKRFAEEPVAPKTAGAFAVSKEDDAGGTQAVEKAAPTQEDIAAALDAMSEEDRAILLIKAAQQLPRPVRMVAT